MLVATVSTAVVPFLNGVEAPDELAAVLGTGPVLGGQSRVFSMVEAPGVVRHFSQGADVEIGELDGGRSARAEMLALITVRDSGQYSVNCN